MSSEGAFLLLRLEGPLQSWGDRSRFWQRETLSYPTKSGVLGLIFCACGFGGPQTEKLSKFSKLPMTIFDLTNEVEKSILTDMQLIGGHYDEEDPWEFLLVPKKSDGKKPTNGGPKMTYRAYLQDASFAVILEIPSEYAEKVALKMKHPQWDIYLGRKCCVPSRPVFQGMFKTYQEAEQELENSLMKEDEGKKIRFKIIETNSQDPDAMLLFDVPVQFGEVKKYEARYVKAVDLGVNP